MAAMSFTLAVFDDDDAPVTREVLDEKWPLEDVKDYARQLLLKYPEAVLVIVADQAANELWRCPEGYGDDA
ncbi:MAG: hypothetical protein JSS35_14710 [Proteobacteria bacterium]|nr:hypothetical protein [Pseudomonadota bacterium]